MKISILIPSITHGSPDADQFAFITQTGDTYFHSLIDFLYTNSEKIIGTPQLEFHSLQHSADQFQTVTYNKELVGFMYVNSTDFHYLNAYFFMRTEAVRSIIGWETRNKKRVMFASPEACIAHFNKVLRWQTRNDYVDAKVYTRKLTETDGEITKLLFMDKIIAIIYHNIETYYFISNEGLTKARERFFAHIVRTPKKIKKQKKKQQS